MRNWSVPLRNSPLIGTLSTEAPVDTVELSDAAVSLLSARNEYAANIKVIQTADEMQRHMLDLLA